MTRPAVFSVPTTLYHPIEGEYTFPAGSPDPGAAWTAKPGGDAPGQATTVQAMKDLLAATEQLEALQRTLAAAEHDKSVLASERDEANSRAGHAEAEAIEAKSAQARAESALAEVILERDTARSDLLRAKAEIAKFDGDGDGKVGGARRKAERQAGSPE